MNFHEFSHLLEMKKAWRGDPPEQCNVCGAKFEPEGEMPEFVFYDVQIPACPRDEDQAWSIVQAIIAARQRDGDKRTSEEIIQHLGRAWVPMPRPMWGHICDACHSAFNQSGKRLLGQRYAVGGDRGKLGEA